MNRSKRGIQKFRCVAGHRRLARWRSTELQLHGERKFVVHFHQKKRAFILKVGVLLYDYNRYIIGLTSSMIRCQRDTIRYNRIT